MDEEEEDALVKGGPRGQTIHGGSAGLEALTGRSEPAKRIARRQSDGPHNGDVGLELGAKALHELLQPGGHVVRWDRVHGVHMLLVQLRGFLGCHVDRVEESDQDSGSLESNIGLAVDGNKKKNEFVAVSWGQ